MRTVKQTHKGSCVACCLAMILDQTEEQVLVNTSMILDKEYGINYTPLTECIIYLAKHKFMYGVNFSWRETKSGYLEKEDHHITHIQHEWSIYNSPAILTVESPIYNCHAIVYDPKVKGFRDPLPGCEDIITDWNTYKIFDWSPILKIEE